MNCKGTKFTFDEVLKTVSSLEQMKYLVKINDLEIKDKKQ